MYLSLSTTRTSRAGSQAHVAHLETEGVLQVVTRLLGLRAGHHGRPLGDVHDHKTTSFGQTCRDPRNRSGDGSR